MIDDAREKRIAKILITTLLCIPVVYFLTLNWNGLLDPDEGRYAEVAREMLATGDFVTPHLNFTKFFDKPPLSYWLTAMLFRLFGQNELAARLGPAICGIITIWLVYLVASATWGKRTGYISSIVLGSSLLFFALAHVVITDMVLTSCVTASMAGFYMVQRGNRRWLPAFYVSMAAGILAKGLIGVVIPVGTAVIWAIVTVDRRALGRMFSLRWSGASLAISLPWFLAVCERNPDFFDYFFIRQHFIRYLTTADNRYEPIWFFLPIVLIGLLPWTGFLLRSMLSLFDAGKVIESLKERKGEAFMWIWAAFTVLFFSLSGSKLIPYILPAFPPLSVVIGREIDSRIRENHEGKNSLATIFTVSLLLVYGIALAALPFFYGEYPFWSIARWSFPDALILWGGSLAVVYLSNPPGNMEKVVVVLGIVGLLNGVCSVGLGSVYASNHSSRTVAEFIGRYRSQGDSVVQYGGFDQGLPFYLGQRVVLTSHSQDMDFGDAHEKDRSWFLDDEGLRALWRKQKKVFLVAECDDLSKLRSLLAPSVYSLQMPVGKVLLSNRRFSERPDARLSRGSDIR
ncbi:glycosyl transferase family 39 [Dethiosulfovibrio peptidovorans DSM 11002]|uniref:Glycosyl transferase family 39 n=1 Tax=Dethiosulfovibrio peptidovorans DSM 11002 TaxID=469381 RepID=D2Z6I8_9BACT|nr:glycosyltransferase family 39 protein [Dethiosulfovibrio peptidovorans]EFC91085.1 glycosyl transferase family 39 [Dethiosulfovibrio peptidovorans DSM 11002]